MLSQIQTLINIIGTLSTTMNQQQLVARTNPPPHEKKYYIVYSPSYDDAEGTMAIKFHI